jgi:hypothetical protein
MPLWGSLELAVFFVPGLVLYSTEKRRYIKDGLQ